MKNIKNYFEEVSIVREIVLTVIAVAIFVGIYLLALPAVPGWGFMWTLLAAVGVPAIIGIIACFNSYDHDKSIVTILLAAVTIILILFMIVAGLGGSGLFHAKRYAATFEPTEVTTQQEDIPSFDKVESVALMDTPTARKLGDRTLGGLSEYVSQYSVSNDYTTISYQGRVMKIAPLEHGSFFKAMKNDTIPGYVIVDCLTSEAKFVKVEEGIKYSPSAFFSKDLVRHIRSEYNDLLGQYYNFQIDEDGRPYWVVTTFEYAVWMSAKVPTGAIVVDAVNGDMAKYSLDNMPEWIEQAVDGDTVTMLYNRHGKLLNGAFNFSDTGKTQVTEDYGYVEKDGDIYIYTGVTSVASDESNIGFIMVNSRTGECKYYPIAGAEEYSAMSAAEGVVQNYGYTASFPSLVMYGDTPTYVMVLKDANGLVKKYAMVNMVNYTIVCVEDTLDACKASYIASIEGDNPMQTPDEVDDNIEKVSKTITIASINFITTGGETFVYVKSVDGECFKLNFAQDERLILLEVGQEITFEYVELLDITPANIKKS